MTRLEKRSIFHVVPLFPVSSISLVASSVIMHNFFQFGGRFLRRNACIWKNGML